MAKNTEYSCSCVISFNGEAPVPLESLTPQQKAEAWRRMTEKIGKNLSLYYTQHPDEYRKLKGDYRHEKCV